MTEKITLPQLKSELAHFTGTEHYWSGAPLFPAFAYTDGVQHLAQRVGAYWLIDLIFSHQLNANVKNAEFQIWTLKVDSDKTAVTTCIEDTDMPVIAQQMLEYTDFPEGEIKLYLIGEERKVLLLPSEY